MIDDGATTLPSKTTTLIVGVTIDDDLTINSNVDQIICKVNSRLFYCVSSEN